MWALRLTIHCLADSGNLLDCACLAAIVSLRHFRRPDVEVIGSDVTVVRIFKSSIRLSFGYLMYTCCSTRRQSVPPCHCQSTTPLSAIHLPSSRPLPAQSPLKILKTHYPRHCKYPSSIRRISNSASAQARSPSRSMHSARYVCCKSWEVCLWGRKRFYLRLRLR